MFSQLTIHSFTKNLKEIFFDFNWQIKANESWAITGNIGVGKTTLLNLIAGKEYLPISSGQIVFDNPIEKNKIEFISFSDNNKWIKRSDYYYQQRYYTSLTEDEITLNKFLFSDITEEKQLNKTNNLIEKYLLLDLLKIPFIQLSNGQKNKAILIKALQSISNVFLLDNPFIGIDTISRYEIFNLINDLIFDGKQVIYTTNYQEFASSTTNILELKIDKKYYTFSKNDYLNSINTPTIEFNPKPQQTNSTKKIIELKNVSVIYDSTVILDNINWVVLEGEKWAILGKNGSGKSTLLSLLYADHPQAYKNKIFLFNEPRKNQSIWEIKSKIGYLSSEFHLHFNEPLTVLETIGTGFSDTHSLQKKLSKTEINSILKLLSFLQILHLKDRYFLTLSFGEQRLVLFARAMVKTPTLLILDEPYQGLDASTIALCNAYIENNLQNVTLIFTSHYQEEIPKSINKILHLDKGKIIK